MSSSRSRLRVGAAILAVFLLGAVSGAAVWHVIYARMAIDTFDASAKGSRHGVFLWSLERKFDLSAEQKTRIEAILKRYDEDTKAIDPPEDQRVVALRQKMRADIRATLAAADRERFDALMSERDAVKGRKSSGAAPWSSAP